MQSFLRYMRADQGWHIGFPIYRHFLKYWLSVSVKVRTDKIWAISRISVIGTDIGTNKTSDMCNRLWLNVGNQLLAKFNRYAIPGADPF